MSEYTVNEILDALSNIEKTASDIMESAENDRKSINADYFREKEKFDMELAEKYNEISEKDEKKNEADLNARIEEIDRESKMSMDNLEKKYKSDKDRLAREIYMRIIEV